MKLAQGKRILGLGLIAGLVGLSACDILPKAEDAAKSDLSGDLLAPEVVITSPADGFATDFLPLKISGTASDENQVVSVAVFGCQDSRLSYESDPCYPQVLVAGTVWGNIIKPIPVTPIKEGFATWEAELNYFKRSDQARDYTIKVATMDDQGNYNTTAASIKVSLDLVGKDTFGPQLFVITPIEGQTVGVATIPVVGKARDAGEIASIIIDSGNGPIPAESLYGNTLDIWRAMVPLQLGANNITIIAKDNQEPPNVTTQVIQVTRDPLGNMVLIKTPSPFTMGYNGGTAPEKPEHLVNLSDYYLDRHEVTLADYLVCFYTVPDPINFPTWNHACWMAGNEDLVFEDVIIAAASPKNVWGTTMVESLIYPKTGREDYPLRGIDYPNVTWNYCPFAGGGTFDMFSWPWYSGGKRLPTEAEWERAARAGAIGPDYIPDGRLNPLGGNTIDCATANVRSCVGHPVAVGSYAPNSLGIYDLAGNLSEWIWDFYQDDYYSMLKPLEPVNDPVNTAGDSSTCQYSSRAAYGNFCLVTRGGSFMYGPESARSTYRGYYDDPMSLPDDLGGQSWWADYRIGFRCAQDAP